MNGWGLWGVVGGVHRESRLCASHFPAYWKGGGSAPWILASTSSNETIHDRIAADLESMYPEDCCGRFIGEVLGEMAARHYRGVD